MEKMTLLDAAKAMGAECRLDGSFDAVCTDTRRITRDCLFICLKGERFDAHDFAEKAIDGGAVAVVCQRDCGLGDRQIIVKSTSQALLDLAGAYRKRFNVPVIGVTGSVGKTSTKEMIHYVLSVKYNTLKNEGNLNNEIGVPLTLFRFDSSFGAAVIEMGMSHRGEIERITSAVRPRAAVISNIGVSHIENLGSRENILAAKMEITSSMSPNAPLILNGDDDMLAKAETGDHKVTFCGIENENCQFRAVNITGDESGSDFTAITPYGNTKVRLNVAGIHNVYNALVAMAAGSLVGIGITEAANALSEYSPAGMRQNIIKEKGVTIIEDCYNASPASQKAALSVLKATTAGRRIAVLGDMLELGFYAEQGHRDVGYYASKSNTDILLTFGENAAYICESGKKNGVECCRHFESKDELNAYISEIVKPGDAFLFKASRGMKFEECVEHLLKDLKGRN